MQDAQIYRNETPVRNSYSTRLQKMEQNANQVYECFHDAYVCVPLRLLKQKMLFTIGGWSVKRTHAWLVT